MNRSSSPRRWRRRLVLVAGSLATGYLLICCYMMFLETSMIFPAPRYPAGNWNAERVGGQEIVFHSADGTQLVGWYLPRENAKNLIIYFHGNGEHIAYVADYIDEYQSALDASVFLFDYRGYGKSQGKPNERGVLADSEAALEWVTGETGKQSAELILVGRSLGGACAVHIAARHRVKAVVLHSTFVSMVDVAAAHYPWLPVRLLMCNQFPLREKIAAYDGPLFQTHGRDDFIVPIRFGRELFDLCPSQNKQFFQIDGGGHNDIEPPECWQAMKRFILNLD